MTFVETIVNQLPKRKARRIESRFVRGGLAPWREARAKQLLRENICGDISVQELAGACGLSVGYFNRAFKQSVGCTPHRWLTHERLELAKQLILNTDDPLCEIALAVGFVRVKQERDEKEAALRAKETAVQAKAAALEQALSNLRFAQKAVRECLASVAHNPRLKAADFHDLRKELLAPSIDILQELAKK